MFKKPMPMPEGSAAEEAMDAKEAAPKPTRSATGLPMRGARTAKNKATATKRSVKVNRSAVI